MEGLSMLFPTSFLLPFLRHLHSSMIGTIDDLSLYSYDVDVDVDVDLCHLDNTLDDRELLL
jgi:hypothetical protein